MSIVLIMGCTDRELDSANSSINLVRVNGHTVTNRVFGKKSKAFFELSKDEQKIISEGGCK